MGVLEIISVVLAVFLLGLITFGIIVCWQMIKAKNQEIEKYKKEKDYYKKELEKRSKENNVNMQ